ncbi:protein disulfide-isomerase A2 [Entelurus aequoreus]|uniref:protein disulfide-isomerase A2 n=1 Tax=Entelurus aequoreus TaxID=161455 RepID=UPI002B1DBF30|nr:protein disulfide-isomerase A2 [Entelurus aequoreus]
MKTFLSVAVLLMLLWASCSHASDSSPGTQNATEEVQEGVEEEAQEEVEEEAKEEKTTEIKEERDVMVLHAINFATALNQTKFLLVEFYAPWCGHCRKLAPIYATAAKLLKVDEADIRLAKVDVTEETELGEEFGIASFPVLRLFLNGDRQQPVDYTGKRTVLGIVQWLKRRTGPGAAVLDSAKSAAHFIDAHNVSVVGFFHSPESDAAKEFSEFVTEMVSTEFGITTSPEVFQKYELKSETVVLFKKFDEGRADFALSEDGKFNKSQLTTFITDNSLELIVPFNQETGENIFTSSIRFHCLLFINSTMDSHIELVDQVRTIAKSLKGKMLFITIDVSAQLSFVLNYFGVSADEAPTVRLVNMNTGQKFIADGKDFVSVLPSLCQQVIDGTAKPHYRSQDIPEDWDKEPVKVLVGKNFDSVALDPTKNVFVEFYAPWCGHCKQLTPIWEQLAENYAERDDIVIAKIDATVNELESIKVTGFPTLKYYPAGGKDVVDYVGKRDLETLSKFLDNGGVLPEEDDDTDDDDNKDEDDTDEDDKDKDDDDKDEDDKDKDDDDKDGDGGSEVEDKADNKPPKNIEL